MNASKQCGIYNPIYPVLKECLERNRENILKTPGVTGVGIGYKVTGGKETDQLALVICVKEKRPEQELAPDTVLPKAFGQQKTDVRQLSLVEPPGFWGAEEQPDVTEGVEEQQVFIYVLNHIVFLCTVYFQAQLLFILLGVNPFVFVFCACMHACSFCPWL